MMSSRMGLVSVLALAFAVPATSAFAATRGGVELPDPTGPVIRGGGGVGPAAPRFRELTPAEQAVELRGSVPPKDSPAAGPETVVDLGGLDESVESQAVGYGIVKKALPAARVSPRRVIDGVIAWQPPTTCGTGTPITNYSRTWSLGDDWGNSKFNAGYEARFTLASTASATPNKDKLSGEGIVRGFATLFGTQRELAKVTGKAALEGTQGTSSINVKVLGSDVWNRSVSGNLTESKAWSRQFFDASQRIWLGPLPVKFTATANGALGYDYAAQYVAPYANLTAKPYAKAYATATASVDAVVASAGVTGNLTLIEASTPGSARLGIQPTYVTYDVDVDLVLKSLSGKIDGWLKVWYLFGSKKWTTTLASWNGVSATYPLVDVNGCLPLAY